MYMAVEGERGILPRVFGVHLGVRFTPKTISHKRGEYENKELFWPPNLTKLFQEGVFNIEHLKDNL